MNIQLEKYSIKRSAPLRECEIGLAECLESGETVFIKSANPQSDSVDSAFGLERENEILTQLDHRGFLGKPNLVSGVEGEALVWPFVRGICVADLLLLLRSKNLQLGVKNAVFLTSEVLRLAELLEHRNRDQPMIGMVLSCGNLSNIWVDGEGNVFSVGLADIRSAGRGATPEYWTQCTAPELILQGPTIDQRADIFAAGVMLFRALTLCDFISTKTFDLNIVYRLFRNVHPVPSDVNPELDAFDPLVERAVRWLPESRYSDPREMITELDGLVTDYISEPEQSLSEIVQNLLAIEESHPAEQLAGDLSTSDKLTTV